MQSRNPKHTCKNQIDVQSLNQCPISTSQISVPQVYVLLSNSQIGVQVSNLRI